MKESTRKQDCESVQELLLRKARNERLSGEESGLVEAHTARCPDCGEEARLYGLLLFGSDGNSPLAPLDERGKNRAVAAVADAFMEKRQDERRLAAAPFVLRRRAPVMAAAAAVLLIVAAYLLVVRQAGQPAASLTVARVTGDARAGAVPLSTGSVVEAGDRLTVGAGAFLALSDGGSCSLFLPGGATVVVGVQGTDSRAFELAAGVLVARAGGDPAPCRLSVGAGDATVVNRGTLFSVERGGDERIVRVVEGTVVVTSAGGEKRTVRAGEKLSIEPAGASVKPLLPREADAILDTAGGRSKTAAGVAAGPGPEEKPGPAAPQETASGDGEKEAAKKAHQAGAALMDAHSLLKKARELRKGKDWDGAVEVFGQIMQRYPHSAEAKIAVISLGEIYLENKDDPGKALTCFNAYRSTHPGGSLFKEASYGVIRCYRKMGQTGKEADEIGKFLARFPDDIYGKKLKDRLEELQAEKQP
jgi:ferric-dicitrate binding protein FerR (iron transport regulator)